MPGLGGTRVSACAWPAKSAAAVRARIAARLIVLQYIAHPSWLDSQLLTVGGAALAEHRDLHQLSLLPGCKHGLAEKRADCDQAGADEGERQVDQRPWPARDAADQVGHLVVGELLGPCQLVARPAITPRQRC